MKWFKKKFFKSKFKIKASGINRAALAA